MFPTPTHSWLSLRRSRADGNLASRLGAQVPTSESGQIGPNRASVWGVSSPDHS